MSEHNIQDEIQLAISESHTGRCFRINVGMGWTGNKIRHNPNGSVTIEDPRPFSTFGSQTKNLAGFSDLLCLVPVTITSDMIGQTVAIIGFVEVKQPKKRVPEHQLNFIEQMRKLGARAGVARSPEEAITILRG